MKRLTGQFTIPTIKNSEKFNEPLLDKVVFVFANTDISVQRATNEVGIYDFKLEKGEYSISVFLANDTNRTRFDMRQGDVFIVAEETEQDALEKWLSFYEVAGDDLLKHYEEMLSEMREISNEINSLLGDGGNSLVRVSNIKKESLKDRGNYYPVGNNFVEELAAGNHGLAHSSLFSKNNKGLDFRGLTGGYLHFYIQQNNTNGNLVAFFNGYNSNDWLISTKRSNSKKWETPSLFYGTHNTRVDSNGFLKLIEAIENPETDIDDFLNLGESSEILFNPYNWYVDGPRTASFSLITNSIQRSMRVYFTARTSKDLIGIIWDSEDIMGHKNLRRETITDYTNTILSFDIELKGDIPDFDDPATGMILDIFEAGSESPYHVRLNKYAERKGEEGHEYFHVKLDFNNLDDGYEGSLKVNPKNITKIALIVVSDGYDISEGLSTPFHKNKNVEVEINNIQCNRSMKVNTVETGNHNIRMCTSYDDDVRYSPEYVVETMYKLGYKGGVNHYCGMSTYFEKEWDVAENRFKVITDATQKLINKPTEEWHKSFAELLKEKHIFAIFSVSYELFSYECPYEWTQRDYYDEFGVTGYEPPSFLLSPCINDGFEWLKKVFLDFADILHNASQPVMMQIGEPWWWWNSSTRRPCIYDYQTKLKYHEKTGLYAPLIESIDDIQPDNSDHVSYLSFLQNELGQSVIDIKDHIKSKYPDSKAAPLIFLPSIVDPAVGIMTKVNYPVEMWKNNEFEFIQTECYDWIIRDKMQESLEAFSRAVGDLGYKEDQLHYLAGFTPDDFLGQIIDPDYTLEKDGVRVWANILSSINAGIERGIDQSYIWAFNQVVRDSVVFAKYKVADISLFVNNQKVIAKKIEGFESV